MKSRTFLSTLAIVLLLGTSPSCEKEKDLSTSDIDTAFVDSNRISLVVESQTIPGDGKSLSAISLISKYSEDLGKTIYFSTTGPVVFENNSDTISTILETNGVATIYIKGISDGTAVVSARIGKRRLSQKVKVVSSKTPVISLIRLSDNILADNYSYGIIGAIFLNSDSSTKQITFTTDRGFFHNGSKTYTANTIDSDTVKAFIRSSEAESSNISVSVSGKIIGNVLVNFINAFPEELTLESSTGFLPRTLNSKVILTAHLTRDKGMVSSGQKVYFYDSTDVNTSVGIILNSTLSNENGIASGTYALQDTSYSGMVYLKAFVNIPSKRLIGTTKIIIPK